MCTYTYIAGTALQAAQQEICSWAPVAASDLPKFRRPAGIDC